ncbi:hypothetical protein DO256_15695 [Salmonella enterica]|nr:hypothetical protein [Salmonella enterica]
MKITSMITPYVIHQILDAANTYHNELDTLYGYVEKCHKKKDYAAKESFQEAIENVNGLYLLIVEQAKEIASLQLLINCPSDMISDIRELNHQSKITNDYLREELEAYNDSAIWCDVISRYSTEIEDEEKQVNLQIIASGIMAMYLYARTLADEIVRLNFRLSYSSLSPDGTDHNAADMEIMEGLTALFIRTHYDDEQRGDAVYNKVLIPDDLHHDTAQLVIDTADTMADKLYQAQEKHGYTNGWRVPAEGEETGDGRNFWTREECLQALFHHLEKGDPIDCINYLAFMQANGWRTELPAQEHASE